MDRSSVFQSSTMLKRVGRFSGLLLQDVTLPVGDAATYAAVAVAVAELLPLGGMAVEG